MKKVILSFLTFLSLAINVAANDANDENNPLSLEFLEFLGSFESPEGEWIDPLEIEKVTASNNEPASSNKEPKDE